MQYKVAGNLEDVNITQMLSIDIQNDEILKGID